MGAYLALSPRYVGLWGPALVRPTDSLLTRVTKGCDPTNPPRQGRESTTHPWIHDDCFGAARRLRGRLRRRCSFLRVGQGSPCHDFGGALRVTDGQSGEGRGRSAAPAASGAPTLTARRHARQSRRLRDRAPPPDGCARPHTGQARRPGQRRGGSGRGSVGGAGDWGGRGSGSTSGSGEGSSSTLARYA
jgi:hypothetical protein